MRGRIGRGRLGVLGRVWYQVENEMGWDGMDCLELRIDVEFLLLRLFFLNGAIFMFENSGCE